MSAKFLNFQLRLTDGLRAVTTAGFADRFRISPSASRSRKAWRTVIRLTPKCSAMVASFGSSPPTGKVPLPIGSRNMSASWRYSGPFERPSVRRGRLSMVGTELSMSLVAPVSKLL